MEEVESKVSVENDVGVTNWTPSSLRVRKSGNTKTSLCVCAQLKLSWNF